LLKDINIAILLLVNLFSFQLFGQNNEQDFKVSLDVKGGITLSNIKESIYEDLKAAPGLNPGLLVTFQINDKFNLRTGFEYSVIGENFPKTPYSQRKLRLHYLTIPIEIRIPIRKSFSWIIGPRINLLINDNSREEISSGPDRPLSIFRISNNDVGLATGIQFELNKSMSIGSHYYFGVFPIDQFGSSLKIRWFNLYFLYQFSEFKIPKEKLQSITNGIGFKIGMNYSNIKIRFDNPNVLTPPREFLWGPEFGIFYKFRFGLWGIQPEIFYNSIQTLEDDMIGQQQLKLKYDYLNFSFNFSLTSFLSIAYCTLLKLLSLISINSSVERSVLSSCSWDMASKYFT